MRHNGATYLTHAARQMGADPAVLAGAMPQMASLAVFPLFHVSGASALLLGAIINGGKIVFMNRWDPAEALALTARERITMLQDRRRSSGTCCNARSSPMPTFRPSPMSASADRRPDQPARGAGTRLSQGCPGGGYGATETNGAIASATGQEYLANPKGSGRVLPGTEVRIVDEHGHDQPLGQVGEVWVKSPLVMAGYWNQPEANARSSRMAGCAPATLVSWTPTGSSPSSTARRTWSYGAARISIAPNWSAYSAPAPMCSRSRRSGFRSALGRARRPCRGAAFRQDGFGGITSGIRARPVGRLQIAVRNGLRRWALRPQCRGQDPTR